MFTRPTMPTLIPARQHSQYWALGLSVLREYSLISHRPSYCHTEPQQHICCRHSEAPTDTHCDHVQYTADTHQHTPHETSKDTCLVSSHVRWNQRSSSNIQPLQITSGGRGLAHQPIPQRAQSAAQTCHSRTQFPTLLINCATNSHMYVRCQTETQPITHRSLEPQAEQRREHS